jgi:hypothetical protein
MEFFKFLPQLESLHTNSMNIFPYLVRQRSLTILHAPQLVRLIDSTTTSDFFLPSLLTDGEVQNTMLPNAIDIDAPFWLLEHVASTKVETLRTIIKLEDIRKEAVFFQLLGRYSTSLRSLTVERMMSGPSEALARFIDRLAEMVPLVEDLYISCSCWRWMVSPILPLAIYISQSVFTGRFPSRNSRFLPLPLHPPQKPRNISTHELRRSIPLQLGIHTLVHLRSSLPPLCHPNLATTKVRKRWSRSRHSRFRPLTSGYVVVCEVGGGCKAG